MVKRATEYPYPMTLPTLLLLLGLYFIIFDLFLGQNDPLCGEVLQKKINKFLQSRRMWKIFIPNGFYCTVLWRIKRQYCNIIPVPHKILWK